MADFTPAPRPDNLKKYKDTPIEPPVAVPKGNSEKEIFDWCEAIRDHHQKKGEFVSVAGLRRIADTAGLDPNDTAEYKKMINKLYREELNAEVEKTAPAKKKDKPSKSKEKPAKTAKTSPTSKKESKKMSKKDKSSKNGKSSSKKDKGNPKRPTGPVFSSIYEKSVKGIDVSVASDGDSKYSVRLSGIPIRNLIRWMGATKWLSPEANAVLSRLLKGANKLGAYIGSNWQKGGEAYVRAVMGEGHLGSGQKGAKGPFGKIPEVPKDVAKALKRLRANVQPA